MPILGYILLFSLLDSVGAILLVATILFLPIRFRLRITNLLVTFAIGLLLGVTFLELLPTAFSGSSPDSMLAATLGGLVAFFILEKIIIWHHCHDAACQAHQASGPLILIGDALHNFIDGAIIAAAFLVSVPVGVATSLAVILHEIFQEAGDLAVLVASGYSRRQAILYDIYSGLTTFVGALIAYYALEAFRIAQPYVLAISSASFLYIALVELIPSQHAQVGLRAGVVQTVLLLAGIGTIVLVEALFGV